MENPATSEPKPEVCMNNSDDIKNDTEKSNNQIANGNKKQWVKFEEEPTEAKFSEKEDDKQPAVLTTVTETVRVNLDRSVDSAPESESRSAANRQLEFLNIQQGFTNGEVLVTVLPVNTRWPWVTPARFKPELVPEELMAQGLTLTVEEYVHAMELLVNDYRFTLYTVCYKRVLVCWITLAFVVLLALLFSGLTGLTLFTLGVMWLILNAAAIFLCMWVKLKLSKGLEKCLADVNKLIAKHKLIVALDDRGRMSCHKVTLCWIYLDISECERYLQRILETEPAGWERSLDLDHRDVVIQGRNTTTLSRRQGVDATSVVMRYLQRWGKDYLRRRLDWTVCENGAVGSARHIARAACPCQFAEELLRQKAPPRPSCCRPWTSNDN